MNMLFRNLYKLYISYTDVHFVAQAYRTGQGKRRQAPRRCNFQIMAMRLSFIKYTIHIVYFV